MKKAIFWDFHETLADNEGLLSGNIKKVLDKYEKDNKISRNDILKHLNGFPWNDTSRDYLHLCEREAWWSNAYNVISRAYYENGISKEKAYVYAREARKLITAPEDYILYEDTVEALNMAIGKGYRNVIVSNHIPELPEIVKYHGLMEYIDICISSANVGYEKPNPNIYRIALERAGNPKEVWMIGDNVKADIEGAEAVGIKAVLVHRETAEPVRYSSPDLLGVFNFIP